MMEISLKSGDQPGTDFVIDNKVDNGRINISWGPAGQSVVLAAGGKFTSTGTGTFKVSDKNSASVVEIKMETEEMTMEVKDGVPIEGFALEIVTYIN